MQLMNSSQPEIDPDQFVRAVQPVIAANDPHCLLAFLKSHWTGPQIISLLRSAVLVIAAPLVGSSKSNMG